MARLIDADKLWKHKFKSASEKMDLDVIYMGGWNDAIDSIVENAPTVDAEPIQHGHWIYKEYGYPLALGFYTCSVCGRGVGFDIENYCPHCGAKMGQEQEGEQWAD